MNDPKQPSLSAGAATATARPRSGRHGPKIKGQGKSRNKRPPRSVSGPQVGPGRPTRFSEPQLADALRRAAGVHCEACRILQKLYGRTVTVATMGRLVNSSRILQEYVHRIQSVRLDYLEYRLWLRIEAGDRTAEQFYLRYQGASRGWSQTRVRQGDPSKPLKSADSIANTAMPKADLRALAAAIRAAQAEELGVDAGGKLNER